MLLMLLCCLIPLALVAAVSVFGFSLGPLQGLVPYVAALMCPLMMVGMMWMMMKNQSNDPSSGETRAMEKDVVCGMSVDPRAAVKAEYQGKMYYFCAPGCKASFDRNPEKYVGAKAMERAVHSYQ